MEKFPLFIAIDHQHCPGRKIDLASDLDLIPFAFEEGSKFLVPVESSWFPRIHHWHMRVRKVTNVSRNNG